MGIFNYTRSDEIQILIRNESNKLINYFNKKLNFWREWYYLGLRSSVRYPSTLTNGDTGKCLMYVIVALNCFRQ